MLSPLPINGLIGASPSPGQLLNSPVGWNFNSPGIAPSPGQYVVQEARLSLEMYGLGGGVHDDRQRGHAEALDLLANDAILKGPAHLHKANSTASLEVYAPAQPQPTMPEVGEEKEYTSELLQAKQKEALEQMTAELKAEMADMVEQAKADVGLTHVDTAQVKASIDLALTEVENNNHNAGKISGMVKEHMHAAVGQRSYKRSYDDISDEDDEEDDDEDEDSEDEREARMPPNKRLASMKILEEQLQAVQTRNIALREAVNQAEARARTMRTENDCVWEATAHIIAAMTAALEARRDGGAAAVQPLGGGEMEEAVVPAHEGDIGVVQPPVAPQEQQQQLHAPVGAFPSFTPGLANGLASIFSPGGDDLFAACNMFVSPLGLLPTSVLKDNPKRLFSGEMGIAGDLDKGGQGIQQQQQQIGTAVAMGNINNM